MLKLLLLLSAYSLSAQYYIPIPKDVNNEPIYGGLGIPIYSAMSISSSSYVSGEAFSLPLTGNNLGRAYRHLHIHNPHLTVAVLICFGSLSSTSCSTDSLRVPAGTHVVYDHLLLNDTNQSQRIYVRYESATSGTVHATVW